MPDKVEKQRDEIVGKMEKHGVEKRACQLIQKPKHDPRDQGVRKLCGIGVHQRKQKCRAKDGGTPPHGAQSGEDRPAEKHLLANGGDGRIKEDGRPRGRHRGCPRMRKAEEVEKKGRERRDGGGQKDEVGQKEEGRAGGRARAEGDGWGVCRCTQKKEQREKKGRRHTKAGGDPAEKPGRDRKGQLGK